MSTVSIEEAQARLPSLIAKLEPGEEVRITEDHRTVARLIGESTPARRPRRPGSAIGRLVVLDDDDDPTRHGEACRRGISSAIPPPWSLRPTPDRPGHRRAGPNPECRQGHRPVRRHKDLVKLVCGRRPGFSTATLADPKADPDGKTDLQEYLEQSDPTGGHLPVRTQRRPLLPAVDTGKGVPPVS